MPQPEGLAQARQHLHAAAQEVVNAQKSLATITDSAHENYWRAFKEYRAAQHRCETILKNRDRQLLAAGSEAPTARGLVDAVRMIEADPWGAFAKVDERFGSGIALALLVSHRYDVLRRTMRSRESSPFTVSCGEILCSIENEIAEKLGIFA